MSEQFETWGVVEVMGHARFAGFISEQVIGGASFVRVDVPGNPEFSKMLGASAIYSITPTSEAFARGMAQAERMKPWSVFDLSRVEQQMKNDALKHLPDNSVLLVDAEHDDEEGYGDDF